MHIQEYYTNHPETPEMTAAATAYHDELEPNFGTGIPYKAEAVAQLISEISTIRKALAGERPITLFENNNDGSIKTNRNGMPIASLTALGRRTLALQRLPSWHQVEQMAPNITFPPCVKEIYSLIDNIVFRQAHEGCLAMQLPGGQLIGLYLNAKLNEARKAAQRKSARSEHERWSGLLAKQAKKVEAYISSILNLACPIEISRMELESHAGFSRPDLLVQQIDWFIREARQQGLFKNVLGHAWRLCLSSVGGYRLHLVLFSDVTNMTYADDSVREIGTYWQGKIEGGAYWHQFLSPYKQFGCGMFYPEDGSFGDYLVEGLTRFLVKNDAFFRPKLPVGMSELPLFGLGEPVRRTKAPDEPNLLQNWRGGGWRRLSYVQARG